MPDLIVIAGPTASGKTSLAVALAKHLNCPILSADSRQFYREMSLGTAKPSVEEQEGVKHYFIDSHSIHKPLSAGEFERESLDLLTTLFKKHEYAIVVGGSGLFIDALVFGTDQFPHEPSIREEYNELFEKEGISALQNKLRTLDPAYYNEVDVQNPMRLIRALEVIHLTGEKYSMLRGKQKNIRFFQTHYFVIQHERDILYDRINQRVDEMVEKGLVEEVKSLLPYKHLQTLNTVGYKELFAHLAGEYDLARAIELIKRNTRRYAKRQLTWFRRNESAQWIPFDETDKMLALMLEKVDSER